MCNSTKVFCEEISFTTLGNLLDKRKYKFTNWCSDQLVTAYDKAYIGTLRYVHECTIKQYYQSNPSPIAGAFVQAYPPTWIMQMFLYAMFQLYSTKLCLIFEYAN
jgi:hypothetical protein